MKKQTFIYLTLFTIIIIFLLVYYFFNNYKSGFTNNNAKTIVLLGDSILNNSNYVDSETTVSALIKKTCSNVNRDNNKIILLAQDTAKVEDVYQQIDSITNNNIDYIFLSIGGNNMLDSKFISLDNLKQKYLKLVTYIRAKFPKSKIYLLGLYQPFDTRFNKYSSNINDWNHFIKNSGYKYIMLDNIIVNKADLVFSIEPSATGSQKIANEICSKL